MKFYIADSEYRFMQVVWDAAPVGSGELVRLCQDKLGWKKSTTYTVLKKMCMKGLLQNEKSMVTMVVPREQVEAQTAEAFVESTFSGSLPGFLAAFMGGKKLSMQEAEELKRLIDAHKED